ncbi:MAG: Uncharacterized protein G01um101444_508, partial [Parcubacteria group bacterium Gr01-1014_44]
SHGRFRNDGHNGFDGPLRNPCSTAETKSMFTGAPNLFLLVFLGITALSLAVADNLALGLYRFIKILELAGLYFYVQAYLGRTISIRGSFLAVIVSGFFQSIIAIGQSLFQHNLGLKWLGESVLRTNFSGVAVVATEGEKFLRAYGTTPHPNVLAAWLWLAIFAFYFLFLYRSQKSTRDYFLLIIYPILLWGLFSTFSRVAIGLWVAGVFIRLLAILFKRKKYNLGQDFKKKLRQLTVVTTATVVLFGFFHWPQVRSRLFVSPQDQAVSQRIFYAKYCFYIYFDDGVI